MESFIFYLTLLDAQPSLLLALGNFIPSYQVKFSLFKGGNPDEISLDSVDTLGDFDWKLYVLHDMRGDTIKGGFGKNGSTSHVKELSFSTI